jgi:hypothetical protein
MKTVVDALEERLTSGGVAAQIFFEVSEIPGSTTVVVGVGRDPRSILDLDSPRTSKGIEVSFRPRPQDIESPELASFLGGLGPVHLVDQVHGPAEVTLIRVGPQGPPQAASARFIGEAPAARPDPSPGERCLRESRRVLWDGFEALALVAPEARAASFEALRSELEASWACAEREPKTKEAAALARTGLTMLEARLFMVLDLARSQILAQQACDAGRPSGCRLAEAIVTATRSDLGGPRAPEGDEASNQPVATMNLLKPTVRGKIDAKAIREVINAHRAPLKACYQQELDRGGDFSGGVEVGFRIDTRGRIKARVKVKEPKPEWEKCLVDVIESMEFPRPASGTVQVTYPMNFAPRL